MLFNIGTQLYGPHHNFTGTFDEAVAEVAKLVTVIGDMGLIRAFQNGNWSIVAEVNHHGRLVWKSLCFKG